MSATVSRQLLDGTPVRAYHFEGGNEHVLPEFVNFIVRCFIEYCIKTGAKGRDGVLAMFLGFICRSLRRAVSRFPHGGSDACVDEIMLTLIDLHDTIKQSPNGFWYNGRLYFGGHNDREDSELVARIRVRYGLKPITLDDVY
eukprot:TRINITY_DN10541_c0_g3_i2.p2 TRINITY_DN10541_c0_g3~~TRINITY_DN10541_c0_g3_i2.p2  ORF type:complete len:142 (-),score=25.89 TRINITY_DN10541_c0_g3_i2:337-762(-)